MKVKTSFVNRSRLTQILLILITIIYLAIRVGGLLLEKDITYGNLKLSFNSKLFSSKAEVLYKKGDLFVAAPGSYSTRIRRGEIKRFVRRYHVFLKVGFYNALFTISLIIAFIFFLLVILQLDRTIKAITAFFKDLVSSLPKVIMRVGGGLFFLAGFFPLAKLYHRLPPLSFIKQYPAPSSIERVIYDFGTLFVVLKKHRLFYAGLFSVPVYLLDLVGISSILVLIFRWARFPRFLNSAMEKLVNAIERFHKQLFYFFILLLFGHSLILFMSGGGFPQHPEGAAALFGARTFSHGALAVPVDFDREFFSFPYLSIKQFWSSQLPPGLALLLLPGVLIGVPWLIFPLLAAASGFLLHRLARDWYGEKAAVFCLGLWSLSPAVLRLGGSFLIYLPFFSCWLGFLVINRFHELETGPPGVSRKTAIVSGGLLGIMFLLSPGGALMAALPFLIYMSYYRHFKQNLLKEWLIMMAVLVGIGIMGPVYNLIVSGKFLSFGYGSQYGQGMLRAMRTWDLSLLHLIYQSNGLNRELFGWPLPSLLFVFLFLVSRSRSKPVTDRLLTACLAIFLLVGSVWFDSLAYKSNPLYILLPLLVLLSVRGILSLSDWLAEPLARERAELKRMILLTVIILTGLNLGGNLEGFNPVRKSRAAKIQEKLEGKSVLFINEKQSPQIYHQAFAFNRPYLKSGQVIVARDLGKYNRKLFKSFKGRNFYTYQPGSPELVKKLSVVKSSGSNQKQ